jgi:predicted ATPase
MKFYNLAAIDFNKKVKNLSGPCAILRKTSWNDYSNLTTYMLEIFSSEMSRYEIGEVKIMDKNQKDTILPEEFESLPVNFCSLGQSINYYELLMKTSKEIRESILQGINDVIYKPEILSSFRETDGFINSLLRKAEAEAALENARKIIFPDSLIIQKGDMTFTYTKRLPEALTEHVINFDFSPKESIPYRTNVFVGKNGSGKSSILRSLAEDIEPLLGRELGHFNEGRVSGSFNFKKIIYLNSSIFDSATDFKTRLIKTVRPFTKGAQFSDEALSREIRSMFLKLQKEKILAYWLDIIGSLLDNQVSWIKNISSIEIGNEEVNHNFTKKNISTLSSGQKLVLFVVLKLAVEIQPNTLILFDEPENYLHPNMLSSLIKAINNMLERKESYCIYSTHSPIMLQETPARSVHLFWRNGLNSNVEKLEFETFGESLHTIVDQVFNVTNEESGFKSWLVSAKSKNLSIKSIEEELGRGLPLNGRLVLKANR